jgi:hypothetical protein
MKNKKISNKTKKINLTLKKKSSLMKCYTKEKTCPMLMAQVQNIKIIVILQQNIQQRKTLEL